MTESSVCFFCAYFRGSVIPDYIRVYLTELKRHFREVRLLTNEKQLSVDSEQFLKDHNISLRLYKNEGYDFGMWSKALAEPETENFGEIALVNDSCILFRPLDQVMNVIRAKGFDYSGLISSNQVSWHIQSFFVVMRNTVLQDVRAYFRQHGLKKEFEEVILSYEVGLCSYLLSMNFRLGTVFQLADADQSFNPSFMYPAELIQQGYPLIKKKMINGAYRPEEIRGLLIRDFRFDPDHYIKLIRAYVPDLIFDPAAMKPHDLSVRLKLRILSAGSALLSYPFKLMRKLKSSDK